MERCLACEAEGSPPQIFLLRHRAGMEIGMRQGSCSPHPANRGTLRLIASRPLSASQARQRSRVAALTNHLSLLTHLPLQPHNPLVHPHQFRPAKNPEDGPGRKERTEWNPERQALVPKQNSDGSEAAS
jgi:hypothetical protein